MGVGYVMMFVGFYLARFCVWGIQGNPRGENLAVAIVEAGIYIQVGINVQAGLTSNADPGPFELIPDLTAFVIMFLCQEACVLGASRAMQVVTSYDDQKLVKEGSVAAALQNALCSIAFAILAANPITKSPEVATLFIFFVASYICLMAMRFVVDKGILFGRGVDAEVSEDNNWGAALCAGAIFTMVAAALSTFLREVCKEVIAATAAPTGTPPPWGPATPTPSTL